jgi:hypothetical protein
MNMQTPVKERIGKLREEIKQISEANRLYMQGKRYPVKQATKNADCRDCRKSSTN